jgi:hypothetical protein
MSQLRDIHQQVKMLREDTARIHYQEQTIEDKKLYVCSSYSNLSECVHKWNCLQLLVVMSV